MGVLLLLLLLLYGCVFGGVGGRMGGDGSGLTDGKGMREWTGYYGYMQVLWSVSKDLKGAGGREHN